MIGPGAIDLKNKAIAWLGELKDKGANTMEIAALKGENESLKGSVATLERQVKTLMEALGKNEPQTLEEQTNGINAADILEDDPRALYEKKFGKPPHHRMKTETIEAALKE